MPYRALLYRRPSEPQAIEVFFDRSIYLVRLRRHRQARRYTLRIQAATREVVLTIPPRGTLKEAREFAQKHGGWIATRLGRLPEAVRFVEGIEVPVRGVPHRIAHRCGARPSANSRPRACSLPPLSASGSSGSRCATRRAAGGPARRRACCHIPG